MQYTPSKSKMSKNKGVKPSALNHLIQNKSAVNTIIINGNHNITISTNDISPSISFERFKAFTIVPKFYIG